MTVQMDFQTLTEFHRVPEGLQHTTSQWMRSCSIWAVQVFWRYDFNTTLLLQKKKRMLHHLCKHSKQVKTRKASNNYHASTLLPHSLHFLTLHPFPRHHLYGSLTPMLPTCLALAHPLCSISLQGAIWSLWWCSGATQAWLRVPGAGRGAPLLPTTWAILIKNNTSPSASHLAFHF